MRRHPRDGEIDDPALAEKFLSARGSERFADGVEVLVVPVEVVPHDPLLPSTSIGAGGFAQPAGSVSCPDCVGMTIVPCRPTALTRAPATTDWAPPAIHPSRDIEECTMTMSTVDETERSQVGCQRCDGRGTRAAER